ncbi:methylmalonyl-CoA mutase family protein [Geochorda subterranea]|uniref:Methylmalonyl-CoA mutase family protein n=2 Tax=Geochorda subterranea TaxID=3109564 RepID=A0ABZ1BR51_9FIRM|nr:methylmalonyl-CoA mutase family protein [Limnochorda sp. LNt]WRP15296.1 methylmalonyl-CoA mutase family protein [Limnochorda sp. LNt]
MSEATGAYPPGARLGEMLRREGERIMGAMPARLEGERARDVTSLSGLPLKGFYGPDDVADLDYERDLGDPGVYPFTRGIHPTMYRGRLWTMRQFAGFGTAEETNARFHYLLEHGQTGLSVAFDLPTLLGYDSDHPRARGEVGREGVAVDSLADMERLFEGIPLDRVSTSMTINGPAAILMAMYVVVGEKQGVPPERLSGTLQNDILKEYIAQKEFIFPPEPSLKLVVDTIEFATRHMPRWNTVSISGYHIREAGSTAVQELAFTLADGLTYVEACLQRGLDVDSFAPRLSFFFNSHLDFFEEVAKFRAARRMWARFMRERYGARNPRSWTLRFHTQTAGCSLTAQQPEVNVVRVTLQALAAVLGGTQSLHTNALDEALSLPTAEAARLALRTQQVIAEESGVASVADPLGGSYFVEALTHEMERRAMEYIERIEAMGGVIAAIRQGFLQREIAEAAYRYQREVADGERVVVGVNKYVVPPSEEKAVPILRIDPELERKQVARLEQVRRSRDERRVRHALEALREAARREQNVMPALIEAVRAYATLGEMVDTLKAVYGTYAEEAIL